MKRNKRLFYQNLMKVSTSDKSPNPVCTKNSVKFNHLMILF